MEENKRAVVTAALSAYMDLLSENVAQLEAAQGKGKGKASDDDVDLESEIRDQIKLCQDLRGSFTEPESNCPPASHHHDFEDQKHSDSRTTHQMRFSNSGSRSRPQIFDDDEPVINPFTGLPIIPETGYEAGPSTRPPAPLRLPQKHPAVGALSKPLPPLKESPDFPPKSPTLALSSQSSRPPKEPPSSEFEEQRDVNLPSGLEGVQMEDQNTKGTPTSKTLLQSTEKEVLGVSSPNATAQSSGSSSGALQEYQLEGSEKPKVSPRDAAEGLSRMSSVLRKPLPSKHQAIPLPFQPIMTPATVVRTIRDEQSPSQILPTEALPEFDDSNVVTSRYNDKRPEIPRSSFVRHIRKLRAKVLKVAEAASPTESARQPALALGNASEAGISSTGSDTGNLQGTFSWEPPPPAYDTLQPISRRTSLSSTSSNAPASVFTSPSRRSNANSPTSTSTSLSPRIPDHSERSAPLKPTNISAPDPSSSRYRGRTPSTSSNVSSSKITSPFKNRDLTLNDKETSSPSVLQGRFSRPPMGPRPLLPVRRAKTLRWPAKNVGMNQIHQYPARRDQAAQGYVQAAKNDMLADEALARALQEEEFREAQLQREILLAYNLVNQEADDDDLELAYFMSRETETLIESTRATTEAKTSPDLGQTAKTETKIETETFDLIDFSEESSPVDPDWLKAQEIQKQFEAEDETLDASLAAARKLQAQFDLQTKEEEAWEAWKNENIDSCIVCGDEHHRDELLRPCEHGYCESCLQEGFKNALSSKTPLRCCKGNLDIDKCTGLEDKFVDDYKEMMLELTTQNPMYCSNPRCGKFLPPKVWAGDVATCTSCKAETCKYCRQKHHPGTFCPEDVETEKVKELGRSKGWKTCPGCNHLIERIVGCLHIVCTRCQTAFCYRCSKKWNECESTCPDAISATHPKF